MYIKERHLEQYGYTPDCKACKRMKAGITAAGSARPHTEDCRKRIEAEMEKDEEGRNWKRKADDKRDHCLEQKVIEAERARQEVQGAQKKRG